MSIRLLWPIDRSCPISQRYGERAAYYATFGLHCGHEGIDFAAPAGATVRACADGTVYRVETDPNSGPYGLQLRIQHAAGYRTIYAHLGSILVRQGQSVLAGQAVGTVGSTGNSTGPHLHLTLKRDGSSAAGSPGCTEINDIIDPTPYLLPYGETLMLATLGTNILAQSADITAAERAAINTRLQQFRPAMVVIMDDPGWASELARDCPNTLVVHRAYRPDDKRFHLPARPESSEYLVPPATFLSWYADLGAKGVVIQAHCEPEYEGSIGRLCLWSAELMQLASARSIRLCVVNLATGNPPEDTVRRGEWDHLLRAFVRYPQHFFGVHEYFVSDPLKEPWHIGRHREFTARARALGIQPPRFLVTEYGRDVGGGERDGYRNTGWSGRTFGHKCADGARIVYGPTNTPAAVFCEGDGLDGPDPGNTPDWTSFNTRGDSDFHAVINAYNQTVRPVMSVDLSKPLPPPAGAAFAQGVLKAVPNKAGFVNIRTQPVGNATDVGDLMVGQLCDYAEPAEYPAYYYVRTALAAGWVSKQMLNGAPTVIIERAPAIAPEASLLTAADLQALASAHRAAGVVHDEIANVLEAALKRQKG